MIKAFPVVLSSDDPAMFKSMGLSFDFFQVTSSLGYPFTILSTYLVFRYLQQSEVTGLLTLGQMARDSITESELCLWACLFIG